MAAASDPYRYVEKRKPIPDPQVYYYYPHSPCFSSVSAKYFQYF